MMNLVENAIQDTTAKAIPMINKAFRTERKTAKGDTEEIIQTQGVNLDSAYQIQEYFDVNKLETNDIYQMMLKYGIESGRAAIIREIQAVFSVYGINVDYRHLSLIADYMTFNGEYRAFNRIGIEEKSSPFLRISYETALAFLMKSAVKSDLDLGDSPSSALVIGKIGQFGTGMVDIIYHPS